MISRAPQTSETMTPAEVCEDYLLSHDAAPGYQRNLRGTAARYQASLEANEAAWSYQSVNRFLAGLRARKSSPVYMNSCRRHIIVLWRHAVDLDEAAEPIVRRIRLAKVPDRDVKTFSLQQVRQLVVAAASLKGRYRALGIRKKDYWSAWIRAKWDTGLRHVDLLKLRRSDIGPDGVVNLVQSKTGKRHRVQVSRETLAAIDRTFELAEGAQRELVFPWHMTEQSFSRHMAKVVELAGLEGNLKMLRASSGTAFENANPGQGHELLGNDRSTFVRHYQDLDRIDYTRPLPPGL